MSFIDNFSRYAMRAFERPVCGGVVTGLAFGLGSYVSLKDKNRTIMGGLYTFDDSNKHILHTIVAGVGFFSAMLLLLYYCYPSLHHHRKQYNNKKIKEELSKNKRV